MAGINQCRERPGSLGTPDGTKLRNLIRSWMRWPSQHPQLDDVSIEHLTHLLGINISGALDSDSGEILKVLRCLLFLFAVGDMFT